MSSRLFTDFVFDPKRTAEELKQAREDAIDPRSGLVTSWSYSTLKNYEQCPYRVYLSKVAKVEEPPQSAAASRGQQIHLLAEQYVRNELEVLPKELDKFTYDFDSLKEKYLEDKVELEGDWGFTVSWKETGWMDNDVWCRMKLDAFVKEDDTSATVIDYKSGRKAGNELAHSSQAQQYVIGAFMRKPKLEFIKAEFWYTDHGVKLEKEYTKSRAMMFLARLEERAKKMTMARDFAPHPSKNNCKWCPHRETGNCEWAIE